MVMTLVSTWPLLPVMRQVKPCALPMSGGIASPGLAVMSCPRLPVTFFAWARSMPGHIASILNAAGASESALGDALGVGELDGLDTVPFDFFPDEGSASEPQPARAATA